DGRGADKPHPDRKQNVVGQEDEEVAAVYRLALVRGLHRSSRAGAESVGHRTPQLSCGASANSRPFYRAARRSVHNWPRGVPARFLVLFCIFIVYNLASGPARPSQPTITACGWPALLPHVLNYPFCRLSFQEHCMATDLRTAHQIDDTGIDLDEQTLLEMYWQMVRARRLDERVWVLHRQGKVAFHISGIGHEGVQVGAEYAMRRGYDYASLYYRDLA